MTTTLSERPGPQSDFVPGAIAPQRFSRLLTVEIRKMVNTRAGLGVIGGTLALVVAGTIWLIVDGADPTWTTYINLMQIGTMLLPVIGLLGMTSEWTQRTALTTFTQAPRRGRVLLAKFMGSLALCAVVFVVMIGILAAGVMIASMVSGDPANFDLFADTLRSSAILALCQVVMAIGFGALVGQTAFAIVIYFMAPTVVSVISFQFLGDNAKWLNVFETYERLTSADPWAQLGPTIVTLVIWVVVPFALGITRSLRREVK